MSWQHIYLNYDQEALALYANIGLVRRARKDIEANKVTLVEKNNEDYLEFEADGQQVRLSAQGIQAASCNCPALGHCKHIISAVLWLQSNASLLDPITDSNNIDDDDQIKLLDQSNDSHNSDNKISTKQLETIRPLANVLTELLSLDASKLLKKASKTNMFTAYQLVCDWQKNPLVTIEYQDSQIRIIVPESDTPIIYMAGTGFDGMISAFPTKQKMAVHLAVIAYLFEKNNKIWTWPIECRQSITHEVDQLSADEITLIKQIQQHIYTLIKQGLSHVSHSQAEQLQLLNMSARSQGLPRLAAMLRHLCQLVELLAKRHFTVEEQDILLFLGQVKAYTEMLLHHQGEQLFKLRGRIKRQYKTELQALDLLPLGGRWWQSKTGAIGATFYFWDSEKQQYQETTLARSYKNDINFNRLMVWNSMSIWQTSPYMLMQKAIKLHQPRVSDSGELSSHGSTGTLQETAWSDENYHDFRSKAGFQNWSILSDYLQDNSLDDSPFNEMLILHIANSNKPYIDEIRQNLVWKVLDNDGNSLFLCIFWDEYEKLRIDVLTSFLETNNQPLTVFANCVKNDNFLDLEPFALLYKDQLTGEIKTLSLDFEDFWYKNKKSIFKQKFITNTYLAHKQQLGENHYMKDAFTTSIIQPLLTILESVTSSGRLELLIEQKQQLATLQYDCDTLGLNTLSTALSKILSHPQIAITHILQAVYLCYLLKKTNYQLPIRLSDL
ncbi:hypothetical protein [Gilliamella sp. ESL0250]|uniref:hypothetical protein n=1 Tax=Gilliamella sp. ESL0250 TaxID=2705036 RepID=UPI00157FE75D|nr:hypothetical protein [Gilliamella sp. ESL0250]NUF49778.1 hypothetical protein [Gilliamella sp. ESL0250]